MISKDCAWMIRDIYRLAKHNLQKQNIGAVEDGVIIDSEYHCIFRLRLHHDQFPNSDEVSVSIGDSEYRGFIELNGIGTVEKIHTASAYSGYGSNITIQEVENPFIDLDFCADFEAASFQAECVSNGMPQKLVDGLVLHNFILDLIEDNYCFVLNTDLLTTNGEFDHNKVQAVHKYFFD